MKYLIILISYFFVSCVSITTISSVKDATPIYTGRGNASSSLESIRLAKIDIIKKAVLDILGKNKEALNNGILVRDIYSTTNPDLYLDRGTLKILLKERKQSYYTYILEGSVNISKLNAILLTLDLREPLTETITENTNSMASNNDAQFGSFLRSLKFMVDSANINSNVSDSVKKMIVAKANEILIQDNFAMIDPEIIERIKAQSWETYKMQTGNDIAAQQKIAESLNAQYYFALDMNTTDSTTRLGFTSEANVTIKMYNTSTGQLLAQKVYNSPEKSIDNSIERAQINALQVAISKLVPSIYNDILNFLKRDFIEGVEYRIVVQGTSDAQTLYQFSQNLRKRVKSLNTESSSGSQYTYSVKYVGNASELEQQIYLISQGIAGLEGLYLVQKNQNIFTYNTGL